MYLKLPLVVILCIWVNYVSNPHQIFNDLIMITAQSDSGVHVNQITAQVSSQGFNAGDIKNAINNLSNEGHIYSTIDENNFQYAE